MVSVKRAYALMHLAILLWGFTGIFGKAIGMHEGMIVWYRMLLSAAAMLPIAWKFRKDFPSKNETIKICLVGTIVVAHWIMFYGAIKASSVSLTLSCFSSISLFTAILDPLSRKKWPNLPELILGVAVITGLYVIFKVQHYHLKGMLLSIGSAFLGALFTVMNKKLTAKHHPEVITFYELFLGFLIFTLLLPVYLHFDGNGFELPGKNDLIFLLLLSVVCTSFAFTISLRALKVLDPFTLNLSVNLEPLYSILLAYIIFSEQELLQPGFITGTIIIITAVIVHSWYKWMVKKKQGILPGQLR